VIFFTIRGDVLDMQSYYWWWI